MTIVDNPDFWGFTQPGKPIKHAGYTDLGVAFDETVAASSSTTIPIYTVPAGKRFMASSGIISCSKSCIQHVTAYTYDGTVLWFEADFDINYKLIDAIIGTAAHEAGWIIKAKFTNNLAESVRFTGIIWGNEIDV